MRKHNWKKGDLVGYRGTQNTGTIRKVDGDYITIQNASGSTERIKGSSSYLIKKRKNKN